MTDFGFGRPAALTSLRELAFAATALRGCVFGRASRLTCKQVAIAPATFVAPNVAFAGSRHCRLKPLLTLRRNSAALRCQHLAKVYDTAHPRAKRKKE